MTFKTFKAELKELERTNLFRLSPPSHWFERLMWAYYATDEGGVMRAIDQDADSLREAFAQRLPDLLLQASQFLLTEKMLPERWAQLTEMYYE